MRTNYDVIIEYLLNRMHNKACELSSGLDIDESTKILTELNNIRETMQAARKLLKGENETTTIR